MKGDAVLFKIKFPDPQKIHDLKPSDATKGIHSGKLNKSAEPLHKLELVSVKEDLGSLQ